MNEFGNSSVEIQAEYLTQLAVAALGNWSGTFKNLKLIKYRENAVFSVDGEGGNKFALRVHRGSYHSDQALRSELDWMKALETRGFAVPRVVPPNTSDFPFAIVRHELVPDERQVDMLEWVDGVPIGSIEEGITESTAKETYREIGILAARLHTDSHEWPKPKEFVRHRWDKEGLLGDNPNWGRFWEHPLLTTEQRALVLEARVAAANDLTRLGQSPSNYGLIHADLVPENLLRGARGLYLIDFDDSGYGWFMFELATALFFHTDADYYPDVESGLFDGYSSVSHAISQEHLPLFFLLRSMTYLGWTLTRQETQTAKEIAPFIVERTCKLAAAYLDRR